MTPAALPPPDPFGMEAPEKAPPLPSDVEIVKILDGYRQEAVSARESGFNPRDAVWEDHLNQYWGRYDFSGKAEWQSRQPMPEFTTAVDRFAAAMTKALVGQDKFFSVEDPKDQERDLADAIERIMLVLLARCSRLPTGQPAGFARVFDGLMKLGAMMTMAAVVVWREPGDGRPGYVAVEALDPRKLWVDPTGRGLYRVRRYEVDKHALVELAQETDKAGERVYNTDQIAALEAWMGERELREKALLKGHQEETLSGRKPVTMDEYLAVLVDRSQGGLVLERQLYLVANERFLIRGPEDNPFWHGQDWVLMQPLVSVPLSQYGRAYMETVGRLTRVFTELTNLILDGVFTSSMKAFAMVPEMLMDPTQAEEGLHPNVTFLLEQGARAGDFLKEVDLGQLPAEAVTVWQALKAELREAEAMNEIAFGQFAPKGRTSATEVASTQENTAGLLEAVARNVEAFLEALLDLVWKTGLQHLSAADKELQEVVGPEMWTALISRRKELTKRRVTFRVRTLTGMIAKGQKLRSLAQLFQIMMQIPAFAQAFTQKYTADKVLDYIIGLLDVDTKPMEQTPREQQMAQLAQAAQQLMGLTVGQPGAAGQTGSPAAIPQPAPQPLVAPGGPSAGPG